jgi:hypothetical protein
MGYDFHCMLKQVFQVIHEGINKPDNVLYAFQEFLNHVDSARDNFNKEEIFN